MASGPPALTDYLEAISGLRKWNPGLYLNRLLIIIHIPSITFETHPSSFFEFEGILTQNNARQGHSNDHQSPGLDFVTKTV